MSANSEVLPWHSQAWARLARALGSDQLSHALLIHGPAGVGKEQFANRLAETLVCKSAQIAEKTVTRCGQCNACQQQSEDGSHADIMRLEPAEGSKEIKIDQARAAIEFSNLAAHYGGRKVILLHPVDRLNNNAANALLKTLEEPPPGTILLLLTDRPASLLATIRSRCQQIRLATPPADIALQWLQSEGIENPQELLEEANGAPLKAVTLAQNQTDQWRKERDQELLRLIQDKRSPSRLAQHWLQFESADIHAWLYDRVRKAQWLNHQASSNSHKDSELKDIRTYLSLDKNCGLISQLNQFSRLDISRLNKQLCMESILFSIMKAG